MTGEGGRGRKACYPYLAEESQYDADGIIRWDQLWQRVA